MYAVLSNPNHLKYGVATIPFPIPRDQYTYCMDLLEALEVGDTVKADCKVVEFDSVYTVLKRMKALTVNVEELKMLISSFTSDGAKPCSIVMRLFAKCTRMGNGRFLFFS